MFLLTSMLFGTTCLKRNDDLDEKFLSPEEANEVLEGKDYTVNFIDNEDALKMMGVKGLKASITAYTKMKK